MPKRRHQNNPTRLRMRCQIHLEIPEVLYKVEGREWMVCRYHVRVGIQGVSQPKPWNGTRTGMSVAIAMRLKVRNSSQLPISWIGQTCFVAIAVQNGRIEEQSDQT